MSSVIFTIDERERLFKMLYTKDDAAVYKVYRLEAGWLGGSMPKYDKIFTNTLGEFFKQQKIRTAKAIYVMPDNYVFCDFVETPTILGKRKQDILALELATRFPNQGIYKTMYVPLTKAEGKLRSVAFMVRNGHIAAVQNALRRLKFTHRQITFESAMVANALASCDAQRKHRPVMFASVQSRKTKVAVVKNGKLLFFTEIPYGKNVSYIKRELACAPSVLTYAKPEIKKKNGVPVSPKPTVDNNVYLLRTLDEMREKLIKKYGLEEPVIKYTISGECAADFVQSAAAYGLKMQRLRSDNLESSAELGLYGGFSTKIYNKGLMF